MLCSACAHDNIPDARFCAVCGTQFAQTCENCAAALAFDANFCSACGHARKGVDDTSNLDGGERRYATVVFSDLCGYTKLNETTDPEVVDALMRHIRRLASEVLERHGGTINQFVGDEVMALFGVPITRRDDSRQAVRALLELHAAVAKLTHQDPAFRAQSLQMHSGVSSGLMVARRSNSRAGHYAVFGDTVNFAARLRSFAEPGEIAVDRETWQQIADSFVAEESVSVPIKGKDLPVTVYRVRGERSENQYGNKPFVGRVSECQAFQSILAHCLQRRRGETLIVQGEPGIGKTRLVREFARAAARVGFRCFTAAIADGGLDPGRTALRGLARSLLGFSTSSDTALLTPGDIAVRIDDENAVFVYDLIDVRPPASIRALLGAMPAAARAEGSSQALARLVRDACGEQPWCVVIEDLHWADAWALRQATTLSEQSAGSSLVLVFTTRLATAQTAGVLRDGIASRAARVFELAPLTPQCALEFATATTVISDELLQRCVKRAAGNPLFLEHLLLNATTVSEAELPGSIHALVQTRVDRLARSDRQTLQAAAVLGHGVRPAVLKHLLEREVTGFQTLTEQVLLRYTGDEYEFSHALVREGAYASLLHTRRRHLHARAGEWFEEHDVALAAAHFDHAHDPRAAPCYLAASREAVAELRHPQALLLAEQGAAVATEKKVRFKLLMLTAELQIELGAATAAIQTCQEALTLADERSDRVAVLVETAAAMRLLDRLDEGLAVLASAQPLADIAESSLTLARLHHLRGNLYFPLGQAAECLHEHTLALKWAETVDSVEARASALGGLGDAHFLSGRMRSAHAEFSSCVDLARTHGFGRLEVAIGQIAGWTAHFLNDMRGAVELGHHAVALASRVFHPRAEVIARGMVAWVDGVVRGNHQQGSEQAGIALSTAVRLGAKRFEAQLRMTLAMLHWRQGDRVAAIAQAHEALVICQQHSMGYVGPFVYGVIALITEDRTEREIALAAGESALEQGAVSHNHLYFRALAIDTCLDLGEWETALIHCARLERYTADEPLPWGDFVIARGQALAHFGQGIRSPLLLKQLTALRAEARRVEFNIALPALEHALMIANHAESA
jgi:class 3 adenylate cyclase/tetratricopeptide (TPR) repeat protein